MAETKVANRQFAGLILPTTLGKVVGPFTDSFACGEDLAIGQVVCLSSLSKWIATDANILAQYRGLIGIVNDNINELINGSTVRVALPGSMIYCSTFPTLTIGDPIYISESSGSITQTQPLTADAAIRILGWAIGVSAMYFFPSPDYMTHI